MSVRSGRCRLHLTCSACWTQQGNSQQVPQQLAAAGLAGPIDTCCPGPCGPLDERPRPPFVNTTPGAHDDGGMPQHGHGLPTRPVVSRELADGTYLMEGMK